MKLLYSKFAAISLVLSLVDAHTWVEQLSVVASNGTFVGTPGYPRAFQPRVANVDPDDAMTYLLPPNGRSTGNELLATDLMCKSSQTVGTQTPGSPALIASAGDMVALRYQENGHVTQPQIPEGKPAGSGTVFVYGTSHSTNNDTFLGIHKVWNAQGTGGNGQGKLLATRYFDDGQCYQMNSSPISQARQKAFPHAANSLMGEDMWCQTDVQLPTDITGNYSLYWVWEWPTLAGTTGLPNGLNQSYTTCMDVQISNSQKTGSKAVAIDFIKGQNLDSAAIAEQLATPYLIDPTAAFLTFTSSITPPVTSFSPATGTSGSTSEPTETSSSHKGDTTSEPTETASSYKGGSNTVTVTLTPSPSIVYVTVQDGTTLTPTTATSHSTVSEPTKASSATSHSASVSESKASTSPSASSTQSTASSKASTDASGGVYTVTTVSAVSERSSVSESSATSERTPISRSSATSVLPSSVSTKPANPSGTAGTGSQISVTPFLSQQTSTVPGTHSQETSSGGGTTSPASSSGTPSTASTLITSTRASSVFTSLSTAAASSSTPTTIIATQSPSSTNGTFLRSIRLRGRTFNLATF